ncbi:MAG: hypothetical protein GYA57_03440 [Myxococcales bacterium]|nr:hypothetical protein [Myxococcales bacterium]
MRRWMRTGIAVGALLACVAAVAAAQAALGKVKVEITANGETVDAEVELQPAGGGRTVTVEANRAEEVPAGTYHVKATLTAALDDPVRTQDDVRVAAGAQTAVQIDFEVSRITLVCRRGDTDVPGEVSIRRPGASIWLGPVRCGEPFLVTGGTYEARVTAEGASAPVAIDRVQIMAGATQRLPLHLP